VPVSGAARFAHALACAAAVLAATTPASAGTRKVAVAPLATLGVEATSAETKQVQKQLEAGLAAVPEVEVIASAAVSKEIKKSKKAALKACDGDGACLAELGGLVAASHVVYAELGGLGDVQVVYLKVVDVGTGKELRSTTLQLGGATDSEIAARGAAFRLLDPERYVGRVGLDVDVAGAQVYVDGKKVGVSPLTMAPLPVGTHALRVTHPEYRDFVRFVDVEFDAETKVPVGLHQFPVVNTDMQHDGTGEPVGGVRLIDGGTRPAPWYRSWWAVAGFGAVLLGSAAVIVGIAAGGFDYDGERTIDDELRGDP
jgi:hypothetical protein